MATRTDQKQLLRALADRARVEEDSDSASFYEAARKAVNRPQRRRGATGQYTDTTKAQNGR